MITRWIFIGFIVLVAIQRLVEVQVSRRHEKALREAGGVEYAAGQVPVMVGLHAAWLVSMVTEVFILDRPFLPVMFGLAFGVFLIGQVLRYSAIITLGARWTVRVIVLPGQPRVERGIYRYIRHPNYVGVGLEMFFLPLLHGAIFTSVIFGLMNVAFLIWRIKAEEQALLKNQLMRIAI
jgi:methyltransferase